MRVSHYSPHTILDELPTPPVPKDFANDVQWVTPSLVASARLPADPWNINLWLTALEQFAIKDMMVYGVDGYGVNSHALHYYLVRPSLAVFLQFPWGGVYQKPVSDDEVSEMLEQISALDCLIDEHHQSLLSQGDKLVVVNSVFAGVNLGVLDNKNQHIHWLTVEGSLIDSIEQWIWDQLEAADSP